MFPDATSRRKRRAFAARVGHATRRSSLRAAFAQYSPGRVKGKRGLRLNMANNPKKVKDPTEVALSAIQEALNISDAPAADSEMTPTSSSSTPAYDEHAFDTRQSADRPIFESIEEPRPSRRAANDDRETIGQILQAIQKGRPA